jgi:hypothetical protein
MNLMTDRIFIRLAFICDEMLWARRVDVSLRF